MRIVGGGGPVLFLVSLAVASCGGGDAPVDCKTAMAAGTPPPTAMVVALSSAQRGQLCDYAACQNGGYGVQHACPSGPSVTFSDSREACQSNTPTNPDCQATVQDLLACLDAIQGSPCLTTFLGAAACDAVTQIECLTVKPSAVSSGAAGYSLPWRPPRR